MSLGRGRTGPAPLSYRQRRLWLLAQRDPGHPLCNLPYAFRLVGDLDLGALSRSLAEVLRRHQVLRAAFPVIDGEPAQVTRAARAPEMEIITLDHPDYALREREGKRLVREKAFELLDLARGSLLRTTLVRLGSRHHLLLTVAHHIGFDARSAEIFFRELGHLYESFSLHRPSLLPPLPFQYADYAAWQRARFEGEEIEQDLAWWKSLLQDAPDARAMPAGHPRPEFQTRAAGLETRCLPYPLPFALERLGQMEGATLFMVLTAAVQTLLHRYSGETRIVTGATVSGRHGPGAESLIGCFTNDLALPARIFPHWKFREVLRSFRETALGAFQRQEVPFERIMREVHPESGLGAPPPFPALVAVHQAAPEALRLHDLEVSPIAMERADAAFDLELHFSEAAGGLEAGLIYNKDLSESSGMRRFLGHLQKLLESIAENPEIQVKDLPLMMPAERHQILVEWDRTSVAPPERCVHEMFELHAERHPQAMAIQAQPDITYGQLNAMANRIAHGLLHRRRGTLSPIVLMMEPAPAAIAAILGILKAGFAFTALDPHSSPVLLRQAVEATQPVLLLCDQGALQSGRQLAGACQVPLSTIEDTIGDVDADAGNLNPQLPIGLRQPAAIVFAWDETGPKAPPKGIIQTHGGLSQYIEWQGREMGHGPGQRIANWAPLFSCASYCEIFGALCFGAGLHIAPQAARGDPALLAQWLQEERISLLQVPSHIGRRLLEHLKRRGGGLSHLKILLLAGAALSPELARDCLETFNATIYRLYGPAESIFTAFHRLDAAALARWRSVPAGQAIDGRQILVLDAQRNPCAIGMAGEVYVRSEYLAAGYLGRPEETAQVFVESPFVHAGPSRLYRTGDLARWLPDGSLELLEKQMG